MTDYPQALHRAVTRFVAEKLRNDAPDQVSITNDTDEVIVRLDGNDDHYLRFSDLDGWGFTIEDNDGNPLVLGSMMWGDEAVSAVTMNTNPYIGLEAQVAQAAVEVVNVYANVSICKGMVDAFLAVDLVGNVHLEKKPRPDVYVIDGALGCALWDEDGVLCYAPMLADGSISWNEAGDVDLWSIDPEVATRDRIAHEALKALRANEATLENV